MNTCKDCIHYGCCPEERMNIVSTGWDFCFEDKSTFIKLPCPIGTDLYRIDSRNKTCSVRGTHRDEWYCQNVLHCYLDETCGCDCGKTYHIFEMDNADAMTILGNAKYFGTRVFLTREEAEKKLEELK